jgi:hypothetical protein
MAGASVRLGATWHLVVQLGFEQTRFAGDSPTFVSLTGNGPTVHADVRVSYFVFSTGIAIAL